MIDTDARRVVRSSRRRDNRGQRSFLLYNDTLLTSTASAVTTERRIRPHGVDVGCTDASSLNRSLYQRFSPVMQLVETFVLAVRLASVGRDVRNQHHLTAIVLEGLLVAFDVAHDKIVRRSGGGDRRTTVGLFAPRPEQRTEKKCHTSLGLGIGNLSGIYSIKKKLPIEIC